jgi:hypothetical protein
MGSKIFIPATKPEDWKSLLAEPEKHWRKGILQDLLRTAGKKLKNSQSEFEFKPKLLTKVSLVSCLESCIFTDVNYSVMNHATHSTRIRSKRKSKVDSKAHKRKARSA